MFQKTHIRLTLLNSLVLIILISVLGSLIFSYTHSRLYRDVDQSLTESIERINKGMTNSREFHPIRDPRILMILWNEQNQIIEPENLSNLLEVNEKELLPHTLNKLTNLNIEDYNFRTISTSIQTSVGKITLQVLRNVNSEQELLDRLLLIMIIGCGIGSIFAIIAGYILAGRALIPIKKAWQKQQQFVSDASHELRTPLAVIQSKSDLLFRSPTATIEDKIDDISIISNETRRLSKLVSKLLTLARSDADEIEIHKQDFELDKLLYEIHEQYSDIIIFQNKTLEVNVPAGITFKGDRERIHQLLVILLDNAIKFTKEQGKITLSCEANSAHIIIKVEDTGIGIKEQDLPKIFDRFFQSDPSRTERDGAGLGLSIAKWIIEKHHGKIKVQSKLHQGTSFEIIFPKYQK